MFHNKTIELPKGNGISSDYYTMTKQSVKLIKSASFMVARWESADGERVLDNSWFKIGINETFRDEKIEFNYFMPINICGVDTRSNDWKICGSISYLCKAEIHPIQALIKEGDVLLFNPYANAHSNELVEAANLTADVIYWEIWRGKKLEQVIKGIFSTTIVQPNNPTRGVIRIPRTIIANTTQQ